MEDVLNELRRAEEGAEMLKALAHPVRLCIARGLLRSGGCNVRRMQTCLKSPQSTISQHLARLRAARIIEGRREGVEVIYRVTSEKTRQILQALFEETYQ